MQSPERIWLSEIPANPNDDVIKHLARYRFAELAVEGGTVLDAACGCGYGSRILAKKADQVIGVDRAEDAINYARDHNAAPNIEYIQARLQDLAFKANSIRTIVTLETLEHLPNVYMPEWLASCASWIEPGGCIVGSSPMLRYDANGNPYVTSPYHINELPRDHLIAEINKAFPGWELRLNHQRLASIYPLMDEHTSFLIFVGRKPL